MAQVSSFLFILQAAQVREWLFLIIANGAGQKHASGTLVSFVCVFCRGARFSVLFLAAPVSHRCLVLLWVFYFIAVLDLHLVSL